jgi:Uma2 family endonuclease
MALVLNDSFLPATLNAQPMTDEEFAEFCAEHPNVNFEATADGDIVVMAPSYSEIGAAHAALNVEIATWARLDRHGYSCDSSAAFVLPNEARRSPDLSWTLKSRVKALDIRRRKGFWPLCPDFVVEIKSPSDRLRAVQKKMREYIANGAQLGWLIDPEQRSVEIYRPEQEPETRVGIDKLEGEGPVAGLVVDLTYVFDPLAD